MRPYPLLGCLLLALCAGTASANPIRMHVELSRRPLGDGNYGWVEQLLTHTITPESRTTHNIGLGASEIRDLPWHPDQENIVILDVEELIRVTLSFDREGGGPPVPGSPSVILDAHLRGSVSQYGPNFRDRGGSWQAFDPASALVNEFADPSISPDLLAYFAENTSFFGSQDFDGSGLHIIMHTPIPPESLLAVPEPTPVPEPATLAGWSLVGLLTMASARCRRRLAKLSAVSTS